MTSRARAPFVTFDRFILDRHALTLHERGVPLKIGKKTLEVLDVLIARAGEIVSSQELVAEVWPDTTIEETSLRVHISSLRKALGDVKGTSTFILNVSGRGYSFVAPLATRTADPFRKGETRRNAPPLRLDPPIGRQDEMRRLRALLAHERLVTLTGPGGMGKTTVASMIGEALAEHFAHGVCFVDLSPTTEPSAVANVLSYAFGLHLAADKAVPSLRTYLKDKHLLLVLDNCEHVVGEIARVIQDLLSAAPKLRVLATSREPLNLPEEWVERLPALGVGDDDDDEAAGSGRVPPAVELFVERARAVRSDFCLNDETWPLIEHVCRQLDGMPLAIELSAVRLESLSLQGLAARLDDLLNLLSHGRRTAPLRHRTLQSLLDWSHDSLSAHEQAVFRRLSVFRSTFDARAAEWAAASDDVPAAAVASCLQSLSSKSLLGRSDAGGETFRLLHTTRNYAAAQLAASGEEPVIIGRHAEFILHQLEQADRELGLSRQEDLPGWRTRYVGMLDDLRTAIDRCLRTGSQRKLGMRLCGASCGLICEFALYEEFRVKAGVALEAAIALVPRDPALELRLRAVLCHINSMSATTAAEPEDFVRSTLALSEEAGTRSERLAALFATASRSLTCGDYKTGLECALKVRTLCDDEDDPAWVLLGQRFLAHCHFHLGDLAAAAKYAQTVIDYPTSQAFRQYLGIVPQHVSMGSILARISWLQGRFDDAAREATAIHDTLEETFTSSGEMFILGYASIPIAIWRGEYKHARALTLEMRAHTVRVSHMHWGALADAFLRILDWHQTGHLPLLTATNAMEMELMATFCPGMLSDSSLERVARGEVGWCAPELMRLDAERRLASDPADATAMPLLQDALSAASKQGALAWELRIAASTAKLLADRDRPQDGVSLLDSVLGRIKQGRNTPDVVQALRLRKQLSRAKVSGGDGDSLNPEALWQA